MNCVRLTLAITFFAVPGVSFAQTNGVCFPGRTVDAGNGPASVAVGDLDGDLDVDLAVTELFGDAVSILLSNGDGTFAENVTYGVGNGPRSIAIGDLPRGQWAGIGCDR